jgi:hypothetical protein
MSSAICIPNEPLAVIFITLPALIFWSSIFTFLLTKFIPGIRTLSKRLDKHGFITEMLLAGVIVAVFTIVVATLSTLNLTFPAAFMGPGELVPSSETESESTTITITTEETPTPAVAAVVEISISSVDENTSLSTSDIEEIKLIAAEGKVSVVQPPWYAFGSKGNVVSVVTKASVVQPPWYVSGERSDVEHVAGEVSTMAFSTSSAASNFASSTAQRIIGEL